jgi:hypothetical protein
MVGWGLCIGRVDREHCSRLVALKVLHALVATGQSGNAQL